jgi:hypothetical protein
VEAYKEVTEGMSEDYDNKDEVIDVRMPRGDYEVMREIIKDRKSSSYVVGKAKTFILTLSGVVAAWFFLGEKFINGLKSILGIH